MNKRRKKSNGRREMRDGETPMVKGHEEEMTTKGEMQLNE